jgi:hypothetical protein
MLKTYAMKFDGALLKRGFWLYVWEIKSDSTHHLYVGRTGDSSSPYAQSPFNRIGQHLNPSPNARGNALGRQLDRAGVQRVNSTFEMLAIGPIYLEQDTMVAHVPFRNQMAVLERATADYLKEKGYQVLGEHPRAGEPDRKIIDQLLRILDAKFPKVRTS